MHHHQVETSDLTRPSSCDIFVYVIYFNFKFLVDKFPGVEGGCSDCWGDGSDCVALGSAFVSGVAGDVYF